MAEKKETIAQLKPLESSLVNFLSMKKDIDDKIPGGRKRLSSLIIGISLVKGGNPLFTVQIGLCEAGFNVETGLKERGSCYGCERYIRDWYERPSVCAEIKKVASSFVQLRKGEISSDGGSQSNTGKRRKYKLDDDKLNDFLDEFYK